MDSLAATPGTGPNTGPLTILRAPKSPKKFAELPERSLVVGILNVTEDSFSDGGKHATPDDAIRAGLKMHYAGADLIDIGGESTRPNAQAVDPEEEARRVLPVIRTLAKAGALISLDTKNPSTARAGIEAGAQIINDVSGNLMETEMAELVAQSGVHYVLTHSRGPVKTEDPLAVYDDVLAEVRAELAQGLERLEKAGVEPEKIIIDPGLGFNKDAKANWEILHHLEQLESLGFPVMIGASRKRFLGDLLASGGKRRPVEGRDAATLALTSLLASRRVRMIRVHDVEASVDAVTLAEALR